MISPATIRIPAKVMLAGEYSVLDGAKSLSFALNHYFSVTVQQAEGTSELQSDLWPEKVLLNHCPAHLEKEPAIELARNLEKTAGENIRVKIKSDFLPSSGFGSSSALRLAMQSMINHFQNTSTRSPLEIAKTAFIGQKIHQGKASGYDFATQVVGGFIGFSTNENMDWKVDRCHLTDPSIASDFIHILVGGRGENTEKALVTMTQWMRQGSHKEELSIINQGLVGYLEKFFEQPSNETMKENIIKSSALSRNFFRSTPNFPHEVSSLIESVTGCDEDFSFKTTGAGGEDSLIVFGTATDCERILEKVSHLGWKQLVYKVDFTGAKFNGELK